MSCFQQQAVVQVQLAEQGARWATLKISGAARKKTVFRKNREQQQ